MPSDPIAWTPTTGDLDVDLLIVSVEDPMPALELRRDHLFGTGGQNNPLGFSDPEVDQLLAKSRLAQTDIEHQDAMHAPRASPRSSARHIPVEAGHQERLGNRVQHNVVSPGVYYTEAASWKIDRPPG